jgi:hypothetical protein
MPCKKCNLETHFRDYPTVDEAVLSVPSQALPYCAESRIDLPCLALHRHASLVAKQHL